jgi:hypothetical protein
LPTSVAGRSRDDLVEQRERVAHRASGLARHEGDGGVVEADAFSAEDVLDARADLLRGQELEIIPLAAGQNRDRNLVHLGRREDELHVRRRLFEGLEQGVERARREHVHLVDDHDLEAVARGQVGSVSCSSRMSSTLCASRRRSRGRRRRRARDLLARRALRRVDGGAVGREAVERLGHDARDRGLAHAARPGEQERVRDASLRNRVAQRLRDVLLDRRGP